MSAGTPAPATAAAEPGTGPEAAERWLRGAQERHAFEPVSPADMARGMGLDDIADRLDRGERVPDSGEEARRAAETAATAPEGVSAPPAALDPEQTSAGQGGPADDPFAAEPAPDNVQDISGLLRLRRQAETYAEFLTRKKLERDGRPAADLQVLRQESLSRIEAVAKQMLGHAYEKATEEELAGKLVPWLRQRYAAEGGKE